MFDDKHVRSNDLVAGQPPTELTHTFKLQHQHQQYYNNHITFILK